MLKLVTEDGSKSSLDEICRAGAKLMLFRALELEVNAYIENHQSAVDENGKKQVVRNGKARERKVTVGGGTIEIQAPRVHDKRDGKKFTSSILPPYLRKSPNVESLLPLLYLKGLPTNAFQDALKDILGESASGLSASSIVSLKKFGSKIMQIGRSDQLQNATLTFGLMVFM